MIRGNSVDADPFGRVSIESTALLHTYYIHKFFNNFFFIIDLFNNTTRLYKYFRVKVFIFFFVLKNNFRTKNSTRIRKKEDCSENLERKEKDGNK